MSLCVSLLYQRVLRRERKTTAETCADNAATGHLNSVKAMHKGLATRRSGYFVQISGATAVSQDEIKTKRFGESTDNVFDDGTNVDKLKDEIRNHPNRTVDNYFLSLTERTPHVRSAIVFGPIIYGEGRGPVHQRSIQIPELCRIALERGRAVQVGKGLNRWGNVHVADIGELFALLVEKAAEGSTEEEVWGEQGLYFAGAGKEIVSSVFPSTSLHLMRANRWSSASATSPPASPPQRSQTA